MAERVGFEPTKRCRLRHFQCRFKCNPPTSADVRPSRLGRPQAVFRPLQLLCSVRGRPPITPIPQSLLSNLLSDWILQAPPRVLVLPAPRLLNQRILHLSVLQHDPVQTVWSSLVMVRFGFLLQQIEELTCRIDSDG